MYVKFFRTKTLKDLEHAIDDSLREEITEFGTIGGDGSLHHLVNYLLKKHNPKTHLKIAILPKGTGNDYIRNFHFPNERAILDSIIKNNFKPVDIGKLQGKKGTSYFVNMLGIGFSAAVVNRLTRYKWLGGLSYYVALLDAFFFYQSKQINIEIDHVDYTYSCFQLSIGIGSYAGHNMMLCPKASIDDGLFEVNIIENVSFWKLILHLHTLKNGSYLQRIPSHSYRAKKIKIIDVQNLKTEADGEKINTPAEVVIINNALDMAWHEG